jgi:hypothetical protein
LARRAGCTLWTRDRDGVHGCSVRHCELRLLGGSRTAGRAVVPVVLVVVIVNIVLLVLVDIAIGGFGARNGLLEAVVRLEKALAAAAAAAAAASPLRSRIEGILDSRRRECAICGRRRCAEG